MRLYIVTIDVAIVLDNIYRYQIITNIRHVKQIVGNVI